MTWICSANAPGGSSRAFALGGLLVGALLFCFPGDAMADVQYTQDWTPATIAEFVDICSQLDCDPHDMLCVLFAESGARATARNSNGGAAGIFQAMPATLKNLGFHVELSDHDRSVAFTRLSVKEQLPYFREYYWHHRGKLVSVAAAYVSTFLPAYIDHAWNPDYTLIDATRSNWDRIVLKANAAFDANGDAKIQVSELDAAVRRLCRGPRWDELSARVGTPADTDPEPVTCAESDAPTES